MRIGREGIEAGHLWRLFTKEGFCSWYARLCASSMNKGKVES